jgi:dihydrofolate reductase
MDAAVFVATSLDGFIARPDGTLDWMDQADAAGEDYGFTAFMDSVEAIVMGRNTFDFVLATGTWAYGETPLIVLTHRTLELTTDFPGRVETRATTPEALARELIDRGIESVYVDGGFTIQSFMRAGLVKRITITRLPILIGSGIPLFGALDTDLHLTLARAESYPNGWTQVEYVVR